MNEIFPDIKRTEDGPLTEPHPIWVSKEMYSQIQDLKSVYGKRAVNQWLRELWSYGLEIRKQSGKDLLNLPEVS